MTSVIVEISKIWLVTLYVFLRFLDGCCCESVLMKQETIYIVRNVMYNSAIGNASAGLSGAETRLFLMLNSP